MSLKAKRKQSEWGSIQFPRPAVASVAEEEEEERDERSALELVSALNMQPARAATRPSRVTLQKQASLLSDSARKAVAEENEGAENEAAVGAEGQGAPEG